MGLVTGFQKTTKTTKADPNSIEGLLSLAQKSGLGAKAQKIVEGKDKPSLLTKVTDVLSRGTYASAGAAKAVIKKENVLSEFWKGLKGQEKETYADVLKEAGIENKYARSVLGFAGDVLLDPTTYIPVGAVAKGISKIAKPAVKAAKAVPVIGKAGKVVGGVTNPIKEAFGKAFVYGYGTTEGLSRDVSRSVNILKGTKKKVATDVIQRYKGLSKKGEQNIFNILVETRKEELIAREAGLTGVNFGDVVLKKAQKAGASSDTLNMIKTQFEKNKELAKVAGIEQPFEAYFPFIRADNIKNIEESARSLVLGNEGYLKKFQAKLKPEEIINSVPEAYARREYQVVRDKVTRESLESIAEKYGKQFASEEEAVKAGYKALKEKGQYGKVVGYLKDEDIKFVNNLFNPEFATIDKLAKASGFDSFNRLWKTAVTKYFPSFHTRNFASGITQNYEVIGKDALNPIIHRMANSLFRDLKTGRDRIIRIGKKSGSSQDLLKPFVETFGDGDWKHIADIGDMVSEGMNPLRLKDFATSKLSKLDYGAKLGEWVESQQKLVAYISGIKQGKSVDDALKLAEQAGFDYSKITQFEQKVLKRIIPFYTFTRKNLELQGRTLLTQPQRIGNIAKAFKNAGVAFSGGTPTEEELAGLPDYVTQGLNIRTGKFDKYGRPIYATAGGTGLEAAIQQLGGNIPLKLLSQTNPILKFIFERATGIDTFRSSGGTITKTADVKTADQYANAPKLLKDWLQLREVKKARYVEGKKVGERIGYEANPQRLAILNALPTSRFVSTAGSLTSKEKTRGEKILGFFTGVKTYPVDIEQQGYFKNKEAREALTRLLEDAGVVKKFETTYIPKKK